jgi:hypothetical protein
MSANEPQSLSFRKLNLFLNRHPFPIPKIGYMIRSMEGLPLLQHWTKIWVIITSNLMLMLKSNVPLHSHGTSKTKFFAEQIEYLGYWINRQGIQPIRNKVEINAILNIKAPKTRKEYRTTPVYRYSQLLS